MLHYFGVVHSGYLGCSKLVIFVTKSNPYERIAITSCR